MEFEQGGKTQADYGTGLLASLSLDLSLRRGKGFSRSNVKCFRQFYLVYPKGAKASHLLSWSHYVELLKLDDELERKGLEFRNQKARKQGYQALVRVENADRIFEMRYLILFLTRIMFI